MSKFRAFPLLIVLALVLAVLTYAFAAANTVTPSVAGDGVGAISGNTVTVHYALNATDPQLISQVDLTLGTALPATTPTVKARLQTGPLATDWSNWFTCTGSGTTWNCPVTGTVTVLSVTNIQVVTAQ